MQTNNNNYNYKKGIIELKKPQKLSLMAREYTSLLGFIMNHCMLEKQKTLKKEFLHILMKTVKQEELKP